MAMACAPKSACLWCSSSGRCTDGLSSECYHHSLSAKLFSKLSYNLWRSKVCLLKNLVQFFIFSSKMLAFSLQICLSQWGKGFSVFPLLASGLGVILMSLQHSTLASLSVFLMLWELCVWECEGFGCLFIDFCYQWGCYTYLCSWWLTYLLALFYTTSVAWIQVQIHENHVYA